MQCEACGSSNSDLNRFCGRCGRPLARVPLKVRSDFGVRESVHSTVVSGPSILGLGADSQEDDDISYLLEDESHSHRGGFMLFLAVLLFVGAAGFVVYQKYYVLAPFSEVIPAHNAPAFAYERTPEAVWEQSKLTSFTPEPALPNRTMFDQLALENISATMRETDTRPTTAADQGSLLVVEGEKYLYGRGVVTNCQLAAKSFEGAADAGNAKAMAHLGSMYGSGRCVKFNRVTAYNWFAQAKNADPDNTWLESSMDMLWRNMSSKERAAILK